MKKIFLKTNNSEGFDLLIEDTLILTGKNSKLFFNALLLAANEALLGHIEKEKDFSIKYHQIKILKSEYGFDLLIERDSGNPKYFSTGIKSKSFFKKIKNESSKALEILN